MTVLNIPKAEKPVSDVEVRYRFDFIKDKVLKDGYEYLKGKNDFIADFLQDFYDFFPLHFDLNSMNALDEDTAYLDVVQIGVKEPQSSKWSGKYHYYECLQDDKGNSVCLWNSKQKVDFDISKGGFKGDFIGVEISNGEVKISEFCTRSYINSELVCDNRDKIYDEAVVQMGVSQTNKDLISNVVSDLEQLLSVIDQLKENGVEVPISDKEMAQIKEDHKKLVDLELEVCQNDIDKAMKALLGNDEFEEERDDI